MVKEYKKPEFKTVIFMSEDVITTSNGFGTPPSESDASRCRVEGTCGPGIGIGED
ncbi:hypothetical protein [Streptococcus ruminantium]|uniref:hypothetical protein n=1 Tax=Streptococcus ruminantium TaxID=1917441 RepID=UPI00280C8D38|nr:hypothetical protein [Streptococcus ruminantium]MDQ8837339.1 hypothetical protein [Streptococcus ruminantium]